MAHCNGVKKLLLDGGGEQIREELLLYETQAQARASAAAQ